MREKLYRGGIGRAACLRLLTTLAALALIMVPGQAWAATATFPSNTPTTYQQGSGRAIGFNFSGTMPRGGDVLVLAWSVAESRMVNEFAHEVTSAPWQISAARLDTLPAGRVQLQLLMREPGQRNVIERHDLEILPRPVVLPEVSFSGSTPSTYQQGSGQSIAFNVDGQMPGGGNVLALAWSVDQGRMVDAFAHEVTSSPWQMQAAKLDTLPAGRVQLQLLLRVPGHDHVKVIRNIEVVPKPEPEPEPVVLPEVSFSSNTPSVYQQGSGQAISFSVDGQMPRGGNVLALAWSVSESRMVNAFAHEMTSSPWRIPAAKLDVLPAGRAQLQLLLRVPGHDHVKVTRSIEIRPLTNPSPGDPGDDDDDDGNPGNPGDPGNPGNPGDPGDPGNPGDPGDPGDGGSVTTGWTELRKSSSTRTIYVSSSQGNDSNDGLSEARPVRSLNRAYQLLRSGQPDWLALKRGDSFTDAFPNWSKSGRSASEPMVITGYGEGPRPRLTPSGINRTFMKDYNTNVRNLWFVGLDFYNIHADPNSSQYNRSRAANEALVFRGRGGGVLIEDCKFSFFVQSFIIEAADGIEDVRFRRNVVVDAYTTGGSHALGGFLRLIDGLVVEDNVFDHNGWSEQVRGADPTIFRHNLYLKDCEDVTIRNNIFANGSSFGLKISSDTTRLARNYVIERNLIVGNANGMTIGHSASSADYSHYNYVIRDNVFSALGRAIGGGDPQAYGLSITTIDTAVVERNYFIHKTIGARQPAIDLEQDKYHRNVQVRNNVVHNWVTINNRPKVVITEGNRKSNVTSSGNLIELPGSRYTDARRTLQTYHASIGGQANIAAFIRAAREQRRGNYFEKYTASKVVDYIRGGYTLLPTFD